MDRYKIEKFAAVGLTKFGHFCPNFWQYLNNELRFFGDARYKLLVNACTDNTAIVTYKRVRYYMSIDINNKVTVSRYKL